MVLRAIYEWNYKKPTVEVYFELNFGENQMFKKFILPNIGKFDPILEILPFSYMSFLIFFCIFVACLTLKIKCLYEPNAVCWSISPRDCHFFLWLLTVLQGTVHVLGPWNFNTWDSTYLLKLLDSLLQEIWCCTLWPDLV